MDKPKLAVTDVCLVTRDLESAVSFYRDKLGFELAHRMPGFVDFVGHGVTLAVWDATAIREATGVPALAEEPAGHGVMVAIELESPETVNEMHRDLLDRGVTFYDQPRGYPWTAWATYFPGPCGEFWELYAWLEDGEPGGVAGGDTDNSTKQEM